MNKIPTMYKRDPEDMKRVLPEMHPDCVWVADGQGTATRKYDGTCVMLDEQGQWWARREVKPGKDAPANFVKVNFDEVTGKTMGWEPIAQSSFASFHEDALRVNVGHTWYPGTYELVGPKINGNPENTERHDLRMHQLAEQVDMQDVVRDFDTLRQLVIDLHENHGWEGIVFHHPDGRMAKLKYRDFPEHSPVSA